KALQDDKTYLCYHGYNCETRNHMSGVFWGRANGWIIYSTTVILQEVNEFIGRDLLLSMLARHIRAIAKFQRNNGMFGTILNDDTAYDEISASAAISAGIKKAVD
ncbi:MAG: glycoside hydrolase family 88 protein, partial [Oscillospiraceae bacterium]